MPSIRPAWELLQKISETRFLFLASFTSIPVLFVVFITRCFMIDTGHLCRVIMGFLCRRVICVMNVAIFVMALYVVGTCCVIVLAP